MIQIDSAKIDYAVPVPLLLCVCMYGSTDDPKGRNHKRIPLPSSLQILDAKAELVRNSDLRGYSRKHHENYNLENT